MADEYEVKAIEAVVGGGSTFFVDGEFVVDVGIEAKALFRVRLGEFDR